MSVLYLIDVSGFIFRAFYALPALTRADGEPIGAVYGFCSMLMKLRNVISFGTPPMNQLEGEDKSDPSKDIILWAGVFDVSRQTFRSEICPTYKANRKQTPHELISQFGLIREACTVFGCAVKEMQNYEADDVIASYARKAQEQGISVVIVSSDKDLMQLYRPGVSIYDPMKSVWITEAHIYEKFGVKPSKVVEVQALAGDPTDGVVGAPGIGIKTAAELVNQFGSLDVLLANAHAISQKKRKEAILNHIDDIRTARKLVTLSDDLDVEINEDELRFSKKLSLEEVNRISEFYKRHGFSQNM